MTYDASEISVASGQPVELYQWNVRNSSIYWRYTSAAYVISYGGNDFSPQPGISRSSLEETDDTLKSECRITIPNSNSMAEGYILSAPEGVVDFTLFRAHGTDFTQYWKGVVALVNPIENETDALFIMGPPTDALGASFLLRRYQRKCDVPLYSNACGINKALWAVPGNLLTVDGSTVTASIVSTYEDDYFQGGWFHANGMKRKIKSHTNTELVLVRAIAGLTPSHPFTAYPGCNHLRNTCKVKFNNLDEYRGCDWIPNAEPFNQGVL